MMKLIKDKTKLIRNILIGVSVLFLIGCEDLMSYHSDSHMDGSGDDVSFTWDMRLPIDENGYYHLEMDRYNHQTLHRMSGRVISTQTDRPRRFYRVGWESDLYWVIGDTLGYVVKGGYTDDWVYVAYDTVYVTQYSGELVRTTNWASYSDEDGMFHNMIAPVNTMIGDTLNVGAYDSWGNLREVFSIVLD